MRFRARGYRARAWVWHMMAFTVLGLFRFRIPFVAGGYVHTAFEFSALEGNHVMGNNQSRKIGKDASLKIKKEHPIKTSTWQGMNLDALLRIDGIMMKERWRTEPPNQLAKIF